MKVLSKSRFKLGLECPNKLFYTRKKQYANSKQEDTFLQALAEGGFQVEELARLHYPDGNLLEGRDGDYQWLHDQTQNWLKSENTVIYEAAFLVDQLFVRCDILEKKGDTMHVIEVKAKSIDPNDEYTFIGKRGGMVSGWKPYLFDLAFQVEVVKRCFPDMKVVGSLMLADKSKSATIDGLNQLFRVSSSSQNRTGIKKLVNTIEECGESVLKVVDVNELLEGIIDGRYTYYDNLNFQEAIKLLKTVYVEDKYANWPLTYSPCKNCEFHIPFHESIESGLKSGKAECFKKQMNLTAEDLEKPNIFDVWNFRSGQRYFENDQFFLKDLSEEEFAPDIQADRMTSQERQWIQIEKAVQNDTSTYVEKEGLKADMETWQYPMHFIDFETSAVALPFTAGLRPYEQVAFQFSHHILNEDGRIMHQTEFLHDSPGVFPNFEFVRALKKALEGDSGKIFKYSNHENTILNHIREQLLRSSESDQDELIAFIEHISHSGDKSTAVWQGERDMIDLCDVVKRYYYNPLTGGSNSLKALLPAVLQSNTKIQEKYSKTIGSLGISSKNFPESHVWIQKEDGQVLSPYKQLQPLFKNVELTETMSEMESLADGGAALTAYAKLQYEDMSDVERQALRSGLLKYCELDTLAMVFVYESLYVFK
jgi:hypothetical protein